MASQVNRNDILAKLDAERQRRREHVIAGKTSPFRTSPVSEWEKNDVIDEHKADSSHSKLGSPQARELLVMKLLEERKKNAARLQQQLLQHQQQDDNMMGSGHYSTNELNANEYDNGIDVNELSESFGNSPNINTDDDRLFQAVNPHMYGHSNMENDVDTEELDDPSLYYPQPTHNMPSSQPSTHSQNLKFLKQHIHQTPAQQSEPDSFASAFQKIQASVYGKTPPIGEGRHINGGWRNTISFGNDIDEFSAQLNKMDKPPSRSSSTHSLSRHSSSTSQPRSFSPHSNASSPRTKPQPPPPQPPLSHRTTYQPSQRPPQPRKAARPSSAPPRPSSATPPKRAATPSKKSGQVSFSGVTAKVARHGIERVESEMDREFQEKCTFAPNTSGKSAGEKVTMTKEKLEQLAKNKKDMIKKREAEKQAMEQQMLDKMTFKPVVTSLPPEYGNTKYQDEIPLVERLYHEADKKVAMRAKAKNDLLKEQLRGCSFKPKIGRPPSSLEPEPGPQVPQKPIYERLGDVQRQRREKLHNLKLQVEEEQKPTFSPYVNPLSRKIVESKKQQQQIEVHSEGEEETVPSENNEQTDMAHSVNAETKKARRRTGTVDTFSRLADLEIEQEKKNKKQEKWQKILADQYTFAPQVNPNTEKILLESEYGSQLDFLDRLSYYKDKRKCAQMQYEQPSYTFQPYINPQTKDMVEQRLQRNGELEMDKYDRLAFGDKQKQALAKQNLEAEYYSRYTFKPNIDKISSIIAPQRTTDELYRDEQKENNKRAAKKAADDAFNAAYTFQPQLYSNPYNHVEPKHKVDIKNTSSISQGIREMEERKALKIQKEKLAQQQKEMEHCTFSPAVNATAPPPPEGPIVVRGLDRFLELKDLAKKLDVEKRERAENAFKVKPSAVGVQAGQPLQLPFTIPAPFHFHTRDRYAEEARQRKLERVNKEMRMNEERELTFQPRTNAKMKQIMIEEILSR